MKSLGSSIKSASDEKGMDIIMLRVEHLSKEIMNFELKDISFHLPKGYIMGLVGVNASGKSSLIKTIINIYHRDSGDIYVDGLSMAKEERAIKNKMGIVLDENYYELNLSTEENAQFFGNYFTDYDHHIFLRYCRRFHVDTKKKLKKLSKGQLMKFQIAFALSHHAQLFIMDEPTANLDQAFRLEFTDIMQDIIADGEKSILLATHQTDTLDQIADYITLMHKGKLVFSMSKEILFDKYILLSGDGSRINSLPEEMIVHRENGIYNSMALIYNPNSIRNEYAIAATVGENSNNKIIPEITELTQLKPTMEEIMYFLIKGGFHNVEIGLEG